MAQKAHRYVYPDKRLVFQYTTSSIEPAEEARGQLTRAENADQQGRAGPPRLPLMPDCGTGTIREMALVWGHYFMDWSRW